MSPVLGSVVPEPSSVTSFAVCLPVWSGPALATGGESAATVYSSSVVSVPLPSVADTLNVKLPGVDVSRVPPSGKSPMQSAGLPS